MGTSKKQDSTIVFQDRDIALLRGLFECRVMTRDHAAKLYFNSRPEAVKKRLQKLMAAALIGELPRKSTEPGVLFLKKDGLSLLNERGVLEEYPPIDLPVLERRARVSELTLRHELEVMDVKASFHVAVAKTAAFSIAEFSTWPALNQFEATRPGFEGGDVLVKPDGFIRIHEKEEGDGLSEHTFFLEVDLSTEVQNTLVLKANGYLDYFKSGGFAVEYGAARSDFKDYPFRVLMVFKSAERRNNLAERLLQNIPPILTRVWLATSAEVESDPLGAIWIRPADYQAATEDTPFAVAKRRAQWAYKKQTAREVFVEQNVKKHRLLDAEAGK